VCPRYFPEIGGVEAHVKELSEWLIDKGFEVDVVCTDPTNLHPKFEIINGVNVFRFLSFAPFDSYFFAPQIALYLKKTSCAVVHAHNYRAFPMLFAAFAMQTDSSKKFIITTHLGFSKTFKVLYKIYNFIFGNYICKKATKIIVVSPAEVLEIPFIKKYQNKIIWIPNGINFNKLSPISDKNLTGLKKLILLFVGRIEKRKGIDNLIRIATNIQDIPIKIILVGDGPYRNHYENIIKNKKIQDKIELKGRIDETELMSLYTQSHIFLLLSEYEAHSIALTEAMSFGLVPIVTNVGGNPYLIKNGITGFLVEYPVQEGSVETIIRMIWHDKDLFKTISENARREIKNNYEINRIFEQIRNVYTM